MKKRWIIKERVAFLKKIDKPLAPYWLGSNCHWHSINPYSQDRWWVLGVLFWVWKFGPKSIVNWFEVKLSSHDLIVMSKPNLFSHLPLGQFQKRWMKFDSDAPTHFFRTIQLISCEMMKFELPLQSSLDTDLPRKNSILEALLRIFW